MDFTFRLVQKNNPAKSYHTLKERFTVGRSAGCDLIIPEPHVSRVQAEVRSENGSHVITNLGRNMLRINGQPTTSGCLRPGDEITFGRLRFNYDCDATASTTDGAEAPTLLVSAVLGEPTDRRLVCTHPSGRLSTHPLDGRRFIIGRSREADLSLDDPSVSRRHCVIENRDGRITVRNISAANPLAVNDAIVTEKGLVSGDKLKIGPFSITYLSRRAEDTQPAARKRGRWPAAAIGLAAAVLLLSAAAAGYRLVIIPLRYEKRLAALTQHLEAGRYPEAMDGARKVLENSPGSDLARQAEDILSRGAAGIAREKAERADLPEAIAYLTAHLSRHGESDGAAALWEQLNGYRLQCGKDLAAADNPQMAQPLLAAIPEPSSHFPEARRLLQDLQNKINRQQILARMLREADAHFAAKRYLVPVNHNAFSAYQAVLAIAPGNETALKRIEQIKAIFRTEGENSFKAKDWVQALDYFERCALMDPEDRELREKILLCNQKLAPAPQPRATPAPGEGQEENAVESDKHLKVRKLLEESGADSARIMNYLFNEPPRDQDPATPW